MFVYFQSVAGPTVRKMAGPPWANSIRLCPGLSRSCQEVAVLWCQIIFCKSKIDFVLVVVLLL